MKISYALCLTTILAILLTFGCKVGGGDFSKVAEAKRNLKLIEQAQSSFFKENGRYAHDLVELRFKPIGIGDYNYPRFYLIGMGDTVTGMGHGAEKLLELLNETGKENGYVAYAVSNLDPDDTLDVWMIDETGKLVHVVDDMSK